MKSIKFKKIKLFSKKVTSVLLTIIICVGMLTLNGVVFATALEAEYCNSLLGKVTESVADGKTTLTVTPNDNVGFRGWYYGGKEVSMDKTVTVESSKAAGYYAELYDFNIVENGNIEAYELGYNFKLSSGDDKWYTVANTATEVYATNTKFSSGNRSVRIKNLDGASYRKITGLEQNSYYTFSFKYGFTNAADYLDYVALLAADTNVNVSANLGEASIDSKKLDSNSGSTTNWNTVKFTFNSGENTEFLFCLKYVSSGSNSIFIDDIVLVKDNISAPTSGNYDFEDRYVADWNVSDSKRGSFGLDNNATYGYRLKGKTNLSYGLVYSSPYEIKTGYTYKFSYTVDLSQVTDKYIPEVDSANYKLIYNDDGTIKYTNTQSSLLFGLSTVKGHSSTVTYDKDYLIYKTIESYTGAYNDSNTKGTGCPKTISDGTKTITLSNKYLSGDSFTKSSLESNGLDVSKPLTITTTFTANKDCTVYIYFRLDGLGTYYVDDVKVERTAPSNLLNEISGNEFSPVGSAIRLSGKQGIRFKTRINKTLLCSDNIYGVRAVEYGTVAALADALGSNELKIGGEYTVNGESYSAKTGVAYSFEKGIDKVFAETDQYIDFTGVLVNISEQNYLSDYAVRSYFKYYDQSGNLQTIYSDTYRPSVYDVAKEAYSAKNKDGSFTENSQARDYLYNDILCLNYDYSISINNTSAPINTDFEGVTSTVYHCYTFMEDPVHGRTYTDEQAAIEMDRLKDSGITSVRTIFKSSFAAGNLKETYQNVVSNGVGSSVKTAESFDGWDWNTSQMKAFYKWAKMLQDRDIDIILNAGWNIPFFISRVSSIPELFYLLGYEEGYSDSENYGVEITYGFADKYNESANYNFTGNETTEERRMIIASLRYGEWMRQALEACEANGVYNVKYLLAFTEPGRKDNPDQDEIDPYFCYPQWTRLVQGLHDALTDAGIRDKYRIIGPNQSIYVDQNRPVSFLQYYLDFEKENPEYAGMVDILSSHIYAKPLDSETSINDPYACYDRAEDNFTYFKEILEENGASDRAFWLDEYNAGAKDCSLGGGVGAQMTQFAAGFTSAMNNGVDNIISWQIFDQLWTPQNSTSGEFIGGVHACGTCPSFATIDDTCTKGENCSCRDYAKYASYTPYVTYYGLNLLGKHMSAKSGSVLSTSVSGDAKGGLYSSSMRDGYGNLIVLAVNTLGTATNVNFGVAKSSEYSKITRYTYNPNGITPTADAISLASDGSFNVNGNSFYDTIPAMSFSIYIYEPAASGDVNIPMDD
ncbi:MAG: hypothetical protein E7551_04125 [Ruminococcaceae bacterium]|nr:hypothetical protein [Oscillospiraceae bacterium]